MAEGNLTPLDVLTGKLTNLVVPVVDNTLTKAGQAADAKATGDAINEVKDDLANQQNELKQYIDEQLGVIENGTY